MSHSERKKYYLGLVLCVVLFIFGEISLNTISKKENPPGGHTLYIVMGSVLMVASVAGAIFLIQKILKRRKKMRNRKKNHIVFLDGSKNRDSKSRNARTES